MRRQHRRAASHRLEHGQAEPLAMARIGAHDGSTEIARQVGEAQVARSQHAEVARHLGDRAVHLFIPTAPTGQHQCRRVVPPMHGLGPATDEVGHVLAWLELAEEGDVGATQTEPSSHARLLRVGRRVEDVGVHAVIGNVDLRGVRVEDTHELVPGRLAGHDDPVGTSDRGAGRGPEEGAFDSRVLLGRREERDVMDRHDNRSADPQRHRVVRRVHDLGAELLRDQWQAGLLPRQPGRAVRDRGRAGDDLDEVGHPAVPLGVGPLAHHRQINVDLVQGAEQSVDITPDAAPVRGNTGCVD